jgi:predicted transposase/invertase (TIGR01784 family)
MNTQPVRYLSPKIDMAFKRVFADHIDLLKSFLNALLPLPKDAPIETLEYLPAEQVPEIPFMDKYSIVDVKCTDSKGRIFIVEMQMLWNAYFGQRVLFGASHAYVKQLKKGQDYDLLQPVYALALINSIFEPNSPDFYHHYKIIKVGEPAKTIEGLEFVFVELPKFKPETQTDKRMASLWLRFLNEIGQTSEQIPDPQLQNEPDIAKAMALMQVSAFNDQELAAYNHSLDEWRTTNILLKGEREEGKVEGIAEGKAVGKVEGKAEREFEIAKALKAQGIALEVIATTTGLTADVIRKL